MAERRIEVAAPAKLNLFLQVVGRRDDGWHELQTVFQFVDICDRIGVESRADGAIVREGGLEGLAPDDDLVVRAARALQAAARVREGATIRVDKRIPAGGGLGGGSSDAAATLVALDRVWGLGWDRARLAALGLGLGADVPVFVHGHAAWAEGVGERLVPIELPEPWYLVIDPGQPVQTGAMFQAPELTRDSRRMTIADFVSGAGRNDFEPLVRARFPRIAASLDWAAGFGPVRLTGTGGCSFVTFDARDEADAALAAMPAEWRGIVARGMNRSPLYASTNDIGA